MRFLVVGFLLMALRTAVRGEYPPNFPKCKNADEACIVKGTNEAIQKYYSGLREINLVPFDPLHVKSIHLERVPSSPVNIDLKLSDLDLTGMKTMQISSFSGLNADLSGRSTFAGIIPEFTLKGHYIVDGRVLLLPITGEGTARLTCKNLHFNFSYDLKPVEKNGKTYAALEHVKLEMDPEKVLFQFDSLFNGDKTLTDTTNEFINANWKEIYGEMKSSISKATGLVMKSVINKFFEKQPYADYFL